MDSLNKDCLFLIGQHLEFSDIYRWSITCKKIKNMIYDNKYFWLKKNAKLKDVKSDNLAKYYYHINLSNIDGLKKACKDGDLELTNYLYFNYNDFILWNIASSYGHLNIIKFLASQVEKDVTKFMINGNCMRFAIQNSHVQLIKYFILQGATFTPNMLYKAVEYNSLEIVSLIQENIKTDFISRFFMRKNAALLARQHKRIEIASYLEGYYNYYFVLLGLIYLFLIRS